MKEFFEKWSKESHLPLEKLEELVKYVQSVDYLSVEAKTKMLDWFLCDLAIDPYFFKTISPVDIAKQLVALGTSQLLSDQNTKKSDVDVFSSSETVDSHIVRHEPLAHHDVLRKIESEEGVPYRFQLHTTTPSESGDSFAIYTVTKPKFAKKRAEAKTFRDVSSEDFWALATPESKKRHEKMWGELDDSVAPIIDMTSCTPDKNGDDTRIMVAVKGGHSRFLHRFFQLIKQKGLSFNRAYAETFLDNRKIYTFYFHELLENMEPSLLRRINKLALLPESTLDDSFFSNDLSESEILYAISAGHFAHQFLKQDNDPVKEIGKVLDTHPEQHGLLQNMRSSLTKHAFSSERIQNVIRRDPKIVKVLFSHFEARMMYKKERTKEDLKNEVQLREEALEMIDREVSKGMSRQILREFLRFNETILKTNFFSPRLAAISFRLSPDFLDDFDYPERPHGIFLCVGDTFVGFHIRFREIARGGIRMIVSRNQDAYGHNLDTLFDENYGLALTQQKKNKDLPEGGAKGTVLLNPDSLHTAKISFQYYIDALLDIIQFDNEKSDFKVQDYLQEQEILFFGPDEGTAEYMDWTSSFGKMRKYPFWKSLSTGKSPSRGGIPHDMDGMTTQSVHEFVLGTLRKLNIEESEITKFQTGGPDGDLGSNEVLISKDKTQAIVDGSGVLFDPAGLNRKELIRLAEGRLCVDSYEKKFLSGEGFFVGVEERDVSLPSGDVVVNGEIFRNTFHLDPRFTGDLFVPCGGRPGAINLGNWKQLLNEEGEPKFRFIIEGANLFLTEQARLNLEKKGVILFKDASTNKGGVTSSSLEVFASLALSDEEYEKEMICEDPTKSSDFRTRYIREISGQIKENAQQEFELLWKIHAETGTPYTILTNEISDTINSISDQVRESSLPSQKVIRNTILEKMCPKVLLEKVPLKTILERVPSSYLDAMVACRIATDFIYQHGVDIKEVEFYNYLSSLNVK